MSLVNVSCDPLDDSGRMVGAAGMSCIYLQASQHTAAFCTAFLVLGLLRNAFASVIEAQRDHSQ